MSSKGMARERNTVRGTLKHTGVIALGMVLATASLAGCKQKEPEEPEIIYELTPVTEDQLQGGKYYVKDAMNFYELPYGSRNFSEEENVISGGDNEMVNNADKSRRIMFGKDDVFIPTLYKDDVLVYVTDVMPESFKWERYYDDGYTVGLAGLELNSTNAYSLTMDVTTINSESSFFSGLVNYAASKSIELSEGMSMVVNAVNSAKLTEANVSECGSITGLTKDSSYNVDVYCGSLYIPVEGCVADTHVLHSYETYATTACNYLQASYIQVVVPDFFPSGYYLVDGVGMVRYINGPRLSGDSGVDFNIPYYLYDEDGNIYTADNQMLTGEGTEVVQPKIDPEDYYSSIIDIDCSGKNVTFEVTYEQAKRKYADGTDLFLSDAEVGFPEFKLYGPDGSEYIFSNSNQEENTSVCSVSNPVSGAWEVRMWNMKDRKFNVKTTMVTGRSDTLFHEGEGAGEITYYLSKSLKNAELMVTWDDTNQLPSDIFIVAPDGETQYTRDSVGESNYDEGRGFAKFQLGEAHYGDYTVHIAGNSLGRVRVEMGGSGTITGESGPTEEEDEETDEEDSEDGEDDDKEDEDKDKKKDKDGDVTELSE